jgi:hypothetical protein
MKKKPTKKAAKPAPKRKRKQPSLFKRGAIPRKKPKKNSYPAKAIQEDLGAPTLNGDDDP